MEELLALMAAEEDDDGQEDVLAWVEMARIEDFPRQGEDNEAGEGGRLNAGTGWTAQEAVERLAEDGQETEQDLDGALGWTAGGSGWRAEAGVQRQVAQALGQAAEALNAVRAEAVEAAAGRGAGDGGELTGAAPGQEAGAGLERLYRQTVRAAAPMAPTLNAGTAGRTVRVEEPGSAASLAVDELDRAIRRDSRRYDGGMSIF